MFARLLMGAALCAVAGSASAAVTVSSTNGPDVLPLPAGQSVLFDFEGSTPAGLTGTGILTSGTGATDAAPYLDRTQYLSIEAGKSATLTLPNAVKSLSLYWGSIDAYNQIAFFDTGGNLIQGFFGNEIPPAPADGSQGDPLNNRRVSFDFGTDRAAYVTLNSSQNSFELDDVAVSSAVPEPASWAMMIFGLGGIGCAMRRSQRRGRATVSYA